MKRRTSVPRALLASALALASLAPPVRAQDGLLLTAVAGVSQFDLSGTGNAFTAALRLDGALRPILLWEGSVGFTFPEQQFDRRTTLFIPEAQIQLQRPGRVAPYLGVGAGLAADFRGRDGGGTTSDATFSGAGGARVAVANGVWARAELRVRGVGTGFEGSAAEWTAGLGWRF